jgi:hypothetical protein
VRSDAATVDEYLAGLPPDRRDAMQRVRQVVLEHLPEGYEERMQYGMISWVVPLRRHPDTYNGEPLALASLANQKRSMSLYLNCVYAEGGERFREEYRATGKRLDMGKSCVRFRSVEDLPLDLVARTIAATPVEDFIALYEASRRR